MKCPYCNKEFTSEKIFYLHIKECKDKVKEVKEVPEVQEELTKNQIIGLLEEKNVEFNKRDRKEILIDLLSEVE